MTKPTPKATLIEGATTLIVDPANKTAVLGCAGQQPHAVDFAWAQSVINEASEYKEPKTQLAGSADIPLLRLGKQEFESPNGGESYLSQDCPLPKGVKPAGKLQR